MSVEEINNKCRSCNTEINTKYEVNQNTINQGFDSFGNIITKNRKNRDMDTITVSIKCPNPNCNKKNWINIDVPR